MTEAVVDGRFGNAVKRRIPGKERAAGAVQPGLRYVSIRGHLEVAGKGALHPPQAHPGFPADVFHTKRLAQVTFHEVSGAKSNADSLLVDRKSPRPPLRR